MPRRYVNLLMGVAIVVIIGIAYRVGLPSSGDPGQAFGGTDSRATTIITQDDPAYQPWFSSIFNPGSKEVESGLFALQAGLGGLLLGFALGSLNERHRRRKTIAESPPDPAAESGG